MYFREFIKIMCDIKEFCVGEILKEFSCYILFLRKEENLVFCEDRFLVLLNRFFVSVDYSFRF